MAARKLKVSTTGYKENSKDKNLDRLYVPSPNLTMTNVKKHVKATPVYNNGAYGNPITMIPGVPSYTFPGAVGVIEEKLPQAQLGLDWEALQNPELAAKAKAMGHNTIAEYRDSNWGYGKNMKQPASANTAPIAGVTGLPSYILPTLEIKGTKSTPNRLPYKNVDTSNSEPAPKFLERGFQDELSYLEAKNKLRLRQEIEGAQARFDGGEDIFSAIEDRDKVENALKEMYIKYPNDERLRAKEETTSKAIAKWMLQQAAEKYAFKGLNKVGNFIPASWARFITPQQYQKYLQSAKGANNIESFLDLENVYNSVEEGKNKYAYYTEELKDKVDAYEKAHGTYQPDLFEKIQALMPNKQGGQLPKAQDFGEVDPAQQKLYDDKYVLYREQGDEPRKANDLALTDARYYDQGPILNFQPFLPDPDSGVRIPSGVRFPLEHIDWSTYDPWQQAMSDPKFAKRYNAMSPDEQQRTKDYINSQSAENYSKSVTDVKKWEKDWYTKRAKLSKFTDLANQRLSLVESINMQPFGDSQEFYDQSPGAAGAFYPEQNYIGIPSESFEDASTILHERSHWYDYNAPQNDDMNNKAYIFKGRSYPVYNEYGQDPVLNDIIPHEYKLPGGISDPLHYGDNDTTKYASETEKILANQPVSSDDIYNVKVPFKGQKKIDDGRNYIQYYINPTEVRARLNEWRYQHNIDPTKEYTNEELQQIIDNDLENQKSNSLDLYKVIQGRGDLLKQLHDSYVSTEDKQDPDEMPKAQRGLRKAQKGLPDDYQDFLKYSETAPENRRPDADWQYGNAKQYDHYGMWEALGKPKTFEEALSKNPQWQPDEYDGMYHGFSTNPETGVWLKSHIPGESEPGNTAWMENLAFALSNDPNWGPKNQSLVFDPELQRMRYIDKPKAEKYVQPEYVEPEITPEILKAFDNDLGAAIQWYRSWYGGRAELPQFTDVANKRLEALDELPGKASVLQNKKFYASSGKGVTGRFLPYDNKIEVPAINYQKAIPNTIERKSPYYNGPPYTDKPSATSLSHEILHYLDVAGPQKNTMFDYDTPQFKGAPRTDPSSGVGLLSTNYYDPSFDILPEEHQYPIPPERTATQNITDRTLRTRWKENEKIERAKGFVDYLKSPTEVRARLNIFRREHNMDPKKQYSTEEILQFIQEDIANPKRNYNIDQLLKIANGDPEVIKKLHDAFVENPTDNSEEIPKAQIMGQFNPSYDVSKSMAENLELNRRAQVAGWNSVDEYKASGWKYNTAPQEKAKKESAAVADWINNDYADEKKAETLRKQRFAEALSIPKEEDKAWVNPDVGYAKPYNTTPSLGAMGLWDPEVVKGFGFDDKDYYDYYNKEYNRSKHVDKVGQIEFDLGFSKDIDAKTKKDLVAKWHEAQANLRKADELVNNTNIKKSLTDYVSSQKEERRKSNMIGTATSTMGPLDALVGLVAAAPILETALGTELLGTGVTVGNVARPLMWAHGISNFADSDSDFRQSLSDYNAGTGDWRNVAATGGLNLLNFSSPKSLLGDFRALGNAGKIGSTGTRFKDLQNLQHFAKSYGYQMPSNIQRIAQSDKLTDMTFRGLMGRHNTFIRGVSTNWPKLKETLGKKWLGNETAWDKLVAELEAQGINYETNPQAAAEYMSTHIPGETGYGRYGLRDGENALYVSNSKPNAEGYTYGNGYAVTVRRPTDFTSPNRLDWISANEYPISYGFKGSPYGIGIVANDYQKRFPTSIRDFVYVTGDPNKQHRLMESINQSLRTARDEAWPMERKYTHRRDALLKATNPKHRRGVLAADYDKSRSLSWTPGEDDLVFKDSPNLLDYGKLGYYNFMKAYYGFKPELAPLKPIFKEMFLDANVYKGFARNAFGELDPFSHYAFKGQPGDKIFDIVRTDKITPELFQNTSRAHVGKGSKNYTRKQKGGEGKPRDHKSLDNYFEAAWSNSRKTN